MLEKIAEFDNTFFKDYIDTLDSKEFSKKAFELDIRSILDVLKGKDICEVAMYLVVELSCKRRIDVINRSYIRFRRLYSKHLDEVFFNQSHTLFIGDVSNTTKTEVIKKCRKQKNKIIAQMDSEFLSICSARNIFPQLKTKRE